MSTGLTEPHYISGLLMLGVGFIVLVFGMRFCVDGWRGLLPGVLLVIVAIWFITRSAALLDPNLRGFVISSPEHSDSQTRVATLLLRGASALLFGIVAFLYFYWGDPGRWGIPGWFWFLGCLLGLGVFCYGLGLIVEYSLEVWP